MTDVFSDCTFEQWVDSYFDVDVAPDERSPGMAERLYWCDVPPATSLQYLTRLFSSADTNLARFSNAQLNDGFWELVGASGEFEVLRNDTLPREDVMRCIDSIPALFQTVFAARCAPVLGHLDEPGGNPLNSICYMWWDVFPMAIGTDDWRGQALLRAAETILGIDHDAIRESALHGLGHAAQADDARAAIADFLTRTTDLRPELRRYALNAQSGCIQ